MLCVLEDIKRILATQKDNITIGTEDTDSMKENDIKESIRGANSIVYAYLRGKYSLPLTKRILLKETTLASTMSLNTQMGVARQIEVILRGSGTINTSTNTIVITGKDKDDAVLTETLIFTNFESQTTENYFKTIDANGIAVGADLLAVTNPKLLILNYDVLSYICQRLSAYFVYEDVYTNNAPNEMPIAVMNWYKRAIDLLEKIRSGEILLDEQTAPDVTNPLLERPYYNIPTKFFTKKGVGGIPPLGDHTAPLDDAEDTEHSE